MGVYELDMNHDEFCDLWRRHKGGVVRGRMLTPVGMYSMSDDEEDSEDKHKEDYHDKKSGKDYDDESVSNHHHDSHMEDKESHRINHEAEMMKHHNEEIKTAHQDNSDDDGYRSYLEKYGYHFNKNLAECAVYSMVNVDGSNRRWEMSEIKDMFAKHGLEKPSKSTWGDVQYVFAMYYSDGFPKVFRTEDDLIKATMMYLNDPDAPEGVAFIRWLAVQDFMGKKIEWNRVI